MQQALLETLPDGAPSKGAIARKLGMSARNLQRHLADEGTTFKDVLNDARADLARTYVAEQRLSVTEIAFVLGFADTSAFSRAFKRWTGVSPRAWVSRRVGRAGLAGCQPAELLRRGAVPRSTTARIMSLTIHAECTARDRPR